MFFEKRKYLYITKLNSDLYNSLGVTPLSLYTFKQKYQCAALNVKKSLHSAREDWLLTARLKPVGGDLSCRVHARNGLAHVPSR